MAATGLAAWAAAMVLLPAPMAARILLVAPLVIVPRLLGALPRRRIVTGLAGWPALVAALPLLVAFSMAPGAVAATLAVPWLVLAAIGGGSAVAHALGRLPGELRLHGLPGLGIDVALGFWAVGALFIVLDRAGLAAGFPPVIVLLTAVHFHVAGFGLLGLAGLLAASRPRVRVPVLGLIAGIPLTALGFMAGAPAVNAAGALLVGLSGIGVAIALLTRRSQARVRWSSASAGAALLVGMPMGIAWSLAMLLGTSFLDMDLMIRTHGALNASAVLLAVLAWPGDSGP